MQIIKRHIKQEIIKKLEPGKVVVIYGPRRVGKTTLIKIISKETQEEKLEISGEDRHIQSWLSSQSISTLKENIGNKKLIIIDEAQNIPHIGINLKLIVDHIPDIKVIATGSSSFDLANQVGEPLVGRKWQFTLFPISQIEMSEYENKFETKQNLENRLIYGWYPEIVTSASLEDKKEFLNQLVDSHLYKDILALDNIRKSSKILDLLKLLAFQIGNDVSLRELANQLDLNFKTIERYLDLLEKVFVIIRVDGFSRNLRKEVTKNSRYYFYDNGVRNAIINNFNDLKTRNDIGQLWENFLFMERLKKKKYKKIYTNDYFWRTYTQKEIDLIEEHSGKLFGYEFKWSEKKQPKAPKDWINTYENASYEIINKENYLDFIT